MVGMTRKKTLFWLCIFLLPNLLGFLIFYCNPNPRLARYQFYRLGPSEYNSLYWI